MSYVPTNDHPSVFRDTDSKGLVATDSRALRSARAQRAHAKQYANVEERVERIEMILGELVRHVSKLVATRDTDSE